MDGLSLGDMLGKSDGTEVDGPADGAMDGTSEGISDGIRWLCQAASEKVSSSASFPFVVLLGDGNGSSNNYRKKHSSNKQCGTQLSGIFTCRYWVCHCILLFLTR